MNKQRWIKWINKVLRSCDTMPVKKDVGNCNDVDYRMLVQCTLGRDAGLERKCMQLKYLLFALKGTISRDKGVCILSQRT